MSMNCQGWFLADDDLILVQRRSCDQLVARTKRGIPKGAISFETEQDAARELAALDRQGMFPLWAPGARPVFINWATVPRLQFERRFCGPGNAGVRARIRGMVDRHAGSPADELRDGIMSLTGEIAFTASGRATLVHVAQDYYDVRQSSMKGVGQ